MCMTSVPHALQNTIICCAVWDMGDGNVVLEYKLSALEIGGKFYYTYNKCYSCSKNVNNPLGCSLTGKRLVGSSVTQF